MTRTDAALDAALARLLGEYSRGEFIPLIEADLQCHLYALLLGVLDADGTRRPEVHANWRLSPAPPALERAKFDLVIGNQESLCEIKFEADYPGVSKPVCFAHEIAKDINRLRMAATHGISGWFLMLDEDGTHMPNLHKKVNGMLDWKEVGRPGRGPAFALVMRFQVVS